MNLLITNTKGIWVVFGLPETHRPENRKQKDSLLFWFYENTLLANAESLPYDEGVI